MKFSRPTILLIVFIALCAVFGLFTLRSRHVSLQFPQRRPVDISDMSLDEQAKINELEGIMHQSEYIKRDQILQTARRNGTISDANLAWVIQGLGTPGPSKDVTVSSIRRAKFFEVLQEIKNYTPSQKEEVFQTMTMFITHPNRTDKLRSIGGFNHLKDARAVVYLTPLLNDTDPVVRRNAARAIKLISPQ